MVLVRGLGGDGIFIENLRLMCRIGATTKERKKAQEVVLDLGLFLDLGQAGTSDRLSHTVDYRNILRAVSDYASGREFRLLEGLAEGIASLALKIERVEKVSVKLRKAKYAESPSIGIEIERAREGA